MVSALLFLCTFKIFFIITMFSLLISFFPEFCSSQVSKQKLMLPFHEYPNVLIRMLNSVIREPTTHLAILVLSGDKQARLDIIQNMEYKFVELMSCDCEASPEQIVQHHITYRYNAMKQRLGIMQGRLQDINNLVKLKNPSLLIQLQKGKKWSAIERRNTMNCLVLGPAFEITGHCTEDVNIQATQVRVWPTSRFFGPSGACKKLSNPNLTYNLHAYAAFVDVKWFYINKRSIVYICTCRLYLVLKVFYTLHSDQKPRSSSKMNFDIWVLNMYDVRATCYMLHTVVHERWKDSTLE